MPTIKHNPYDLLEKEHISKSMLSEKAVLSLGYFDKAKALFEKRPASKEFQQSAEKAGEITSELMRKDIARIQKETTDEIQDDEKKETRRVHSKKIMEKSEKVFDDLEACRTKLKEDRRRKLESGEIQAPKKKTLVTKLRNELIKTVSLIPKNLKDDASVIERTHKAILTFLTELKSIWGLNKIKPIEDEIKQKFKKLEEHITKL